MKSPRQKLHYDERIKQISMQQAKDFFLKRPNARWMSANIGETEYFLIENVKEKEVKVPVIKTITKYVLKEIPKEIPVEITKEVEKIITKVVTKVVTKERKKVVYRQTPEYLKLKRETQSLTAQVKIAEYDKKTNQLESEIEKLKKELEKKDAQLESENEKYKKELEKKDIDIIDDIQRKHITSITKELDSLINFIKEETTFPIIVAQLPAAKINYTRWYFFIYGKGEKKSHEMEIGITSVLCNFRTGIITKDQVKQKEMEKHLNRHSTYNSAINMNMILDIVKMFKNIENVGYAEKFIIQDVQV